MSAAMLVFSLVLTVMLCCFPAPRCTGFKKEFCGIYISGLRHPFYLNEEGSLEEALKRRQFPEGRWHLTRSNILHRAGTSEKRLNLLLQFN